MSVQDSESRRFEHLAEFFSGRSWPKIGAGIISFGFFEKFKTFFSKICAHSEQYINLLAGIFKILTFYSNIAFPLSPVLRMGFFVLFCFCPIFGFLYFFGYLGLHCFRPILMQLDLQFVEKVPFSTFA